MDLTSYGAWKFDLSAILRALVRQVPQPAAAQSVAFRDLFARLAADRFNIALVGRFSRGKTSLMNAILGMDRLPTGVVPLTSVITEVTYGSEAKAVLHYQGSSLFMDIKLSELAAHITERGNPGNYRGVAMAEVQLPAEFLRRGFTFIDTPGIGSAIAANTRTTQGFLPDADAIILVTSHDGPLSEEEAGVLAWAGVAGRPLFVVLNKQDTVDAPAREQALAYVREAAGRLGAGAQLRLFSLSASQGLAARLARDPAALAASGLPALESALVHFLVHDQRRAFLLGMCDRIAALPGAATVAPRLAALRAQASGAGAPAAALPEEPPLPALLADCEICAGIAQAVWAFFTRVQAELYGSEQAQAGLAARGGFCRAHAQQFEAVAAGREAATALAPVLLRQAGELRRIAAAAPGPAQAAGLVGGLLPDGLACPACTVARRAEAVAVQNLAGVVRREGAMAVHTRSALCLPHLRLLLAALPGGETAALLRRQAALMERIAEDAGRFALKQDAARQGSLNKQEREAAWRAARVLLEAPQAQYDSGAPGPFRGLPPVSDA